MKWWPVGENCLVATDDTDDYARRTRAIDRLGILLGPRARRDVDLAPYTTYKVGGPASILVTAHSIDDLHAVSNALREQKVPVLVIGRGSNLLVADEGFDGLVIVLGEFAQEISWPKRPAPPRVTAGGAVPLPVLARQCATHALTGFEWGVGVPGSVGGAVRMNAGGHGSDIASSIESAKIFHLGKGIVANVRANDLGLRFRGSDLQPYHIVLSATFALSWGDQAASEQEMSEIVRWRREHQPGGQNAGSVFVNPEPGGGSAGAIIDRLGLRGLRIGTAEVSTKHANFIQCDEGGSAADVADLMADVRERVFNELGVDLRSEVRLVGFDEETADDAGAQTTGSFEATVGTTRALTALDKVFGPLVTDDTLGTATIAPPLPDDAVSELRELFADTGAFTRPVDDSGSGETPASETNTDDASSGSAPSGDTPVADVVDISTASTMRNDINGDNTPPPIVIDDSDHLLPHERPEGSATLTLDPTSPFADASTGVPGAGGLADVIIDRRIGQRAWWKRFARPRVSPLVAFAALIGVVSLVLVVLASPIFAVRDIEVSGVTYTDPLLLESVSDSLRGASVFTADLDGAQRRLEGDPWVQRARLSWYLPDRVVIEVDERTPVAWFVGVDNRARVLDADGRVLDVLDGQPTQFLKIEGVGPNLPAGTVPTLVYQAAAQLAISFPEDIRKQLKHVVVNGPEALGFVLKTGTVVKLGAPVDIRNKLTIVATVLARQDPEFIAGIDVSSGQPIIDNG
ncbi:MAG: UDP-N-acetylmuramate dehydrogenase [Actinomycetota bacterium]|jgi:UDP-N-acetylmuramate dehydrogenase